MQNPMASTLHKRVAMRRTWLNRAFALLYTSAIFAHLYNHFLNINLISTTTSTLIISLLMLLADSVFIFMWATYQGFRMSPVRRQVFIDNIPQVLEDDHDGSHYPALDVFICTADPSKEPPMKVVNTALSVMGFDYPMEKLSVYVSDDGGSESTLFAFMEAAQFAAYWLPYCTNYNILERCPEAYFKSQPTCYPETHKIKMMYENMKVRVEKVVERGSVCGDDMKDHQHSLEAFGKWRDQHFTPQDHPTVIQVVMESGTHKDVEGHVMPNLIYVSREKHKSIHHHFKAGALNVLLRVSATMTNAPIVLILDCDMYSNDPKTPLHALCFHLHPPSQLAFVQFPQLFHGINKPDIYAAEFKFLFQIDASGMDGLLGPILMGTGCFVRRRAFFGGPSSFVAPENPMLSPHNNVNDKRFMQVLDLAHHVAGSRYEAQTKWGSQIGFRYGSAVEDFFTGYHLHCQGWKSIFCQPNRPAFLGNAPMTLDALLTQTKRWALGASEVAFSKYSPLKYGFLSMNTFQVLCYTHYSTWPIWCIPITIYAFLPQLALINSLPLFPKITDVWFLLYTFLFLGAYGQDFLEFVLAGGTVEMWWNNQRMWMIRLLSSFSFALVECLLNNLGISTSGFNVTSKVIDTDITTRYAQGMFEFGTPSPLFLPLTTAAIINLFAFIGGIAQVFKNGIISYEHVFVQMFIAGFVVVNGWPFYEAMILRTDKGKMPLKITFTSLALAWILYSASSLAF